MNSKQSTCELASSLTGRFFSHLSDRLQQPPRTFGFEYEFLPDRQLEPADLLIIDSLLGDAGGLEIEGERIFSNGLRVTFEPGGQIEYCSPPLKPDDEDILDRLLEFIRWLNELIYSQLKIRYIGAGYIADRKDAPLCLRSQRYLNLHRRLAISGTRGHEMMKGTAAVHLHASICSMDELVPLFYKMCEMVSMIPFKMSAERRDIWNHTDPSRCGMPPCCTVKISTPAEMIERWVQYAIQVITLGGEVPFLIAPDRTFESFCYHLTTIFTDIRFNLKGPTLELRTPDSVPIDRFKMIWKTFIDQIQKTLQ